jgi:hypothetical protein
MRQELEDLCSQQGNYKALRAKIAEDQEFNKKAISDRSITPSPIIPYLGMFLTDLTFGEEGNSDFVSTEHYPAESKVMFNISKFALMSKTILQLRTMSVGSFPFVFNQSYHGLLCSLQVKHCALICGEIISDRDAGVRHRDGARKCASHTIPAGDGRRGMLQEV